MLSLLLLSFSSSLWIVERAFFNRECRKEICDLRSTFKNMGNIFSIATTYQQEKETNNSIIKWFINFKNAFRNQKVKDSVDQHSLKKVMNSINEETEPKRLFALTLFRVKRNFLNKNVLNIQLKTTGNNGYYVISKEDSGCEILNFENPGFGKNSGTEINQKNFVLDDYEFSQIITHKIFVILANPVVMLSIGPKVIKMFCEQSNDAEDLRGRISFEVCVNNLKKQRYIGNIGEACSKKFATPKEFSDTAIGVVLLRKLNENEVKPVGANMLNAINFVILKYRPPIFLNQRTSSVYKKSYAASYPPYGNSCENQNNLPRVVSAREDFSQNSNYPKFGPNTLNATDTFTPSLHNNYYQNQQTSNFHSNLNSNYPLPQTTANFHQDINDVYYYSNQTPNFHQNIQDNSFPYQNLDFEPNYNSNYHSSIQKKETYQPNHQPQISYPTFAQFPPNAFLQSRPQPQTTWR